MKPVLRHRIINCLIVMNMLMGFFVYAHYAQIQYPPRGSEYHAKLGRAFLNGHTYLGDKPSQQLLELKNPYGRLHKPVPLLPDASLYQKKYYLYFGPVPAIVIWIPVKILTGIELRDWQLVLLFCSLGTCLLTYLLGSIAIRNKKIPLITVFCTLLCMAYATGILLLLRVPVLTYSSSSFYQVAIAGGYFFTACGITCLWKAQNSHSRQTLWKLLGSLSLGLAVGSRSFYGLNAIILFVLWWGEIKGKSYKESFQEALKLGGPWLVCLGGIFLYNYIRFENIFETGFRYQLTATNYSKGYAQLWNLKYLKTNFYQYFLIPWNSDAYKWDISLGKNSLRHYQAFFWGIFTLTPFSIFCIHCAVKWNHLNSLMKGVLLYTFSVTFFLLCYFARTNRYQFEFAPWIMLLAVIGYFQAISTARPGLHFYSVVVAGALLALWSVYCSLVSNYLGFWL